MNEGATILTRPDQTRPDQTTILHFTLISSTRKTKTIPITFQHKKY